MFSSSTSVSFSKPSASEDQAAWPGEQGPVAGDLVMFDGLSGGYQPASRASPSLKLFKDLLALSDMP